MTARRWLLIIGAVLWLVLLILWGLRGGTAETDGGWDLLSLGLLLLPLLLANEIFGLIQRRIRARRENRDA